MILWSLSLMINFQNKCFYCLILDVGQLVRRQHKLISIYTVGQVSFWVMDSRNILCIISCILGRDLSVIPPCISPCACVRTESKCSNRSPVQVARKPEWQYTPKSIPVTELFCVLWIFGSYDPWLKKNSFSACFHL